MDINRNTYHNSDEEVRGTAKAIATKIGMYNEAKLTSEQGNILVSMQIVRMQRKFVHDADRAL